MGSRAVVLVCRTPEVAQRRFGHSTAGAVHTRTGRSFFPTELGEQLLDRIRSAIEHLDLWRELGTDWLLLDTEVLPWSAKAEGLIRAQYATTGVAAESSLDSALAALRQAEGRGLDVSELTARTEARVDDARRFREQYRHHCWPTDGLEGIRIAPFQLLATEGRVHAATPHEWHLELADRLSAADGDLFATTGRRAVDTEDAESVAEAVRWWEELTAAGGEGIVVKPADNLVRGKKGLVQPGVKVRGREYLRLVYGPEYAEPQNLERLRNRSLGRKRSLALREHALGLEALHRLAEAEPLWRIHECVFAVLALESEPVDPRL